MKASATYFISNDSRIRHATDAGYDARATYFSAPSIFAKDFMLMATYTAPPAPRVNWGFKLYPQVQILSLMLNLLGRNQELPIRIRRSAHGVWCRVAPPRSRANGTVC
jgi:hypothetical protein